MDRRAFLVGSGAILITLKDWRRLAIRFDRCAHSFLSTIQITAIAFFWINQWVLALVIHRYNVGAGLSVQSCHGFFQAGNNDPLPTAFKKA